MDSLVEQPEAAHVRPLLVVGEGGGTFPGRLPFISIPDIRGSGRRGSRLNLKALWRSGKAAPQALSGGPSSSTTWEVRMAIRTFHTRCSGASDRHLTRTISFSRRRN